MFVKFLKRFLNDETGATAAEYALLLAVISGTLVAAAFVLGSSISGSMENTAQLIGQGNCGQGTGWGCGNGGGNGGG